MSVQFFLPTSPRDALITLGKSNKYHVAERSSVTTMASAGLKTMARCGRKGNARITACEDQGVIRNYICTDCFLWTRLV